MWKDEPCHSWVSWSKFKSFYLRLEGRTKSLKSALVKILSPTTYGWKDQPSCPWVPWYKILFLLPTSGRTNQVTHECLGRKLSPSTYGWKDEPSHLQVPWSKIKVLLPMSGRTNQATSKCLGTKFKSFCLRVEGRTKSLGQNLCSSTYEWNDEPSPSRVPWSKFKSFYLRVEGRTKPPTSALLQISVLLLTGGRTNRVTYRCLGRSLKSYYLRVEGRTKPSASGLIQNLSPSTYEWKDKPSHSRVSWSKFKSF